MTTRCPLCAGTHPSCHFIAGSLYCNNRDCRNPHHQAAPRPEWDEPLTRAKNGHEL